jgi:hypothetical protein
MSENDNTTMANLAINLACEESVQTAIDFLLGQRTALEQASRLSEIYNLTRSMLKHGDLSNTEEIRSLLEHIKTEAAVSVFK